MRILEQRLIKLVQLFLLFSIMPLSLFAKPPLYSNYIFRYTIYKSSLGPVDGIKSYEVLVKESKIVQVANTSIGVMLASKDEAEGLAYIFDVIANKKNNYQVTYNKNGFPEKINIYSKNNTDIVGNANLIIYLYDYKKVSNSFNIEESNIQKMYFNLNYKKWLALNLVNYTFRYQDSAIENRHTDGVRIKVSSNKISDLIDEFTFI